MTYSDEYYKSKYLKYKNKYLLLSKKLKGGSYGFDEDDLAKAIRLSKIQGCIDDCDKVRAIKIENLIHSLSQRGLRGTEYGREYTKIHDNIHTTHTVCKNNCDRKKKIQEPVLSKEEHDRQVAELRRLELLNAQKTSSHIPPSQKASTQIPSELHTIFTPAEYARQVAEYSKLARQKEISNEDVNRAVNQLGFEIVKAKGDGNCLFRSLSLGLYGDEEHHAEIRADVIEYMGKNRDKYKNFIGERGLKQFEEEELNSDQLFNRYIAKMSNNFEFGTHLEIDAFTHVYEYRVNIFDIARFKLTHDINGSGVRISIGEGHNRVINIIFDGNMVSGHYDFLRPIQQPFASQSSQRQPFASQQNDLKPTRGPLDR